MIVVKTSRKKSALISYKRERKFRDALVIFSKRSGNVVFLTIFNNIYITYEIITTPVENGTYQIKITSVDNLFNEDSGVQGSIVIDFYPLPPIKVVASLSGNDVTLDWQQNGQSAPDNYVVYGNGGSGNVIDRSNAIATVSGVTLTSTFTVANGSWDFVVESIKSGVVSAHTEVVHVDIPQETVVPPKPGPSSPESLSGLNLRNVSVGKVELQWLWLHGAQAESFNIYYDNGTGVVDYVTPVYNVIRVNGLIQTFTTDQLHFTDEDKTYIFVVRAVSPDGVEDINEDEYPIAVDGKAPDDPIDLSLSTVF